MNNSRSPLGGELVSKKEAYKGLGNPQTWEADAAKLMADFHKKPRQKLSPAKAIKKMHSAAKQLRNKVTGFISPLPGLQPSFAKPKHARAKRTGKKTAHRATAKQRRKLKPRRRPR